jgi:O-antigen ligase
MGIVVTIVVGLAAVACFVNPVWGICAYIATIIIRPNEMVEGVKLPAIPVMIIAMALSYLLHMSKAAQPEAGPRSRASLLLVLMLVLLVAHFIFMPSDWPLLDWILAEAAPTMLLLFYFSRHMATTPRLQAGLTTLSASSALLALDALVVHFFRRGAPAMGETLDGVLFPGHGEPWNSYHLHGLRLTGLTETMWGNPNDLGMVTNWGIVGCLFYLRRQGSKLLRLAALGLMGLLATVLFLTGSRGGQLQMGINLWLVFIGGKRKAVGVVLLLLALVGAMVVLPRLSPERADAGESKDERTGLLLSGLRLFKSHPIQGCGFMRFPYMNDFKKLLPHNVYIQALAETGLVGALIFFPLMFYLRRETSRAVKHFNTSGADPPAALLATCIGALQFSYSIFILFSNQFMSYRFGLVMTMAMGLYRAMLVHKDQLGEGQGDGSEQAGEDVEAAAPDPHPVD